MANCETANPKCKFLLKNDVATCLETETGSPVAADTAACLAVTALDDATACAAVKLAADGTTAACTYTAAANYWPAASSVTTKKTCSSALPGHDCHFKCKKKGTHTGHSIHGSYTSATGEYLDISAGLPNGDGTCTACPAFVSVSANGGPIPS